MINEANCGFFVPAGDVDALVDKMKQVHAMPVEDRTEMGMRGRQWLLENRRYDVMAKKFIEKFLQ